MCCNGTLFPNLVLRPHERDIFGRKAECFTASDGVLKMKLGCSSLSDMGACAIYKGRPITCRGFSCLLLSNVEMQMFTVSEALQLVAELHEMFRALQKICQDLMPKLEWPYLLVGQGALMALINEAQEKGDVLSAYNEERINTQQRMIVQFIRQYFRAEFMQPFIMMDIERGNKQISMSQEEMDKLIGK